MRLAYPTVYFFRKEYDYYAPYDRTANGRGCKLAGALLCLCTVEQDLEALTNVPNRGRSALLSYLDCLPNRVF